MTGRIRPRAAVGAALIAAVASLVGATAAAEEYDQKFRDEFMRRCIIDGGTYTACQCTMQRIESAIAFDKFVAMEKAVQADEKADQQVLDAWDAIRADCVAVKKE